MTRFYTPAEIEILASIAHRRVTGVELAELLPDRTANSARSALDAYRKRHGIPATNGAVWTPEALAARAEATAEAMHRVARTAPPPPRGYDPDEIAWAEENAPHENEEAILILAHLGHDMRLPGKPPRTEMRMARAAASRPATPPKHPRPIPIHHGAPA